MLQIFSKLSYILLLLQISISGPVGTALLVLNPFVLPAAGIVDKIYLAQQNPNVVDNFGTRIADAAIDPAELEYTVDVGPITGTATANYVYSSFFNPSGSGRTALIKKIAARSNAVAAANHVNLSVRRISAASGGTQITAANIPKKNTGSSNPVLEVRHTGPTVTFSGIADSRIIGQPTAAAVGVIYSARDISFDSSEPIVLQPGEGIVVYQEAAGDVDLRVRAFIQWEEVASAPTAQSQFLFAFPRVEVAATANYVYNSFFNPAGSGRTAVVKRVWFGTETCDTTAVYTNLISLKRISAASGGTQILASNVPKKHTGSANSVMDFRRSGVTVTQVGGTDARIDAITPCGTTNQAHGWVKAHLTGESLILQPGQGIAVISEAVGDVDQLVRMIIEWEEVVSTPAAEGEYIFSYPQIAPAVAPVSGTNLYTFFNPSGSGRTAVIKRIAMRTNAAAAATYSAFVIRRVTAASAGTLITASDVVKKHTGTSNTLMELRHCGTTCATAVTATYAGTADSKILTVNGAGAVGQTMGSRELRFTDTEPLIVQPGEGIGMYVDVIAGSTGHRPKLILEWGEVASAPSAQGEYVLDIGPINGNAATSYTYATLFNPSASGKTIIVDRVSVRVDAIAGATYRPMQLRRISAASGGTQITAENIPKKHTSTVNSIAEIRQTGPSVTYSGSTNSLLLNITSPGAAEISTGGLVGYKEVYFVNDESIILQPGEGVGFYHDNGTGDVDVRVKLLFEWDEVPVASTPASQGEYMISSGTLAGTLTANHVYASFFNPSGSGVTTVIKRIGIRANRTGTLVAPGYIPLTIRPISTAADGIQVSVSDIPKKHSSTANSTADIRIAGSTVTFSGVTDSRILGVMAPGAVNQTTGQFETEIIFGDEIVLQPGEGFALYQEAAPGDTLLTYRLNITWNEVEIPVSEQSLTFSISDDTIGFGTLVPSGTRYATGDTTGATSDTTSAHTISVSTNASSGYVILLSGNTLTCTVCGSTTIAPIGGVAASPSVGTEQFGVRATVVSGTGTVNAPYNGAQWAFDTSNFPDGVASGSGDGVTTQFGVRYMSNIAASTVSGPYQATITFTAIPTF